MDATLNTRWILSALATGAPLVLALAFALSL
jgi:hypothetical protein